MCHISDSRQFHPALFIYKKKSTGEKIDLESYFTSGKILNRESTYSNKSLKTFKDKSILNQNDHLFCS